MGAVYQGIPEISVNGIKGKFAGGWIYNYDLSIGYSEEPNKLNLSMVLEDNKKNFDIPGIDLKQNTFTISFGSSTFIGYLYSSRIEINSSEKILHCTFVDKSIILDQVYVGLNHRFTFGEEGAQYHILIGEEVEVSNNQSEKKEKVRCISCSTLEEVVVETPKGDPSCDNTDDSKGKYDIQYRFSDLVKEISRFVPFDYISITDGWGSYTGTLREVLSSWGSDRGFTFFYDFQLGKLSFIDLAMGIPISIPSNINSLKIKSYTNELTAEGSYVQGVGTFTSQGESENSDESNAKRSTRIYNFTKETYTQLNLKYIGPAWSADAELGLLGSADSESRDNYCAALGLYTRVGWKSPFGYMINLAAYRVRNFAEIIGDSNLLALASEPWAQIIYTEVNEALKEYYMNRERVALDSYGKLYQVQGAVPPVNRTDVECVGSSFRKITTYEWYPPFNDLGRWMKDTGTSSVGQIPDLWSKADTVYSLEGDTEAAFRQYFTEVGTSSPGRMAIVFVGASTFFVPYCCSPNTSEEVLHNPNTQPWQHNCPLQCENAADPCDAYLQCSSNPYNVQQGITSNGSYGAGNVVAPAIGDFVGWHKKNEEYTKIFPGNSTSDQINFQNKGSIPDGRNAATVRYLLVDTSNGGEPSGGGGAGSQQIINYEFIGLPDGILLEPRRGLSSLSINLSSNGLFSKVTFQSRPNPPAQEKTLQKVTPRKTLFK